MTRGDLYWRSSMSGGRAELGSRRKRGRKFSAQSGDISAIHELGHPLLNHFLIECKHYKSLDMDLLVWGLLGQREEIWDKPRRQAREHGLSPFCVVKQNFKEDLLLLDRVGKDLLVRGRKSVDDFPLMAVFPPMGMYVFLFADLLTDIDHAVLEE